MQDVLKTPHATVRLCTVRFLMRPQLLIRP
jgi:hypothetical protein